MTVGDASQNSRARTREPALDAERRAAVDGRRPFEGRNDNSTSPEGEMLFYVDA